jgi:hypothetical protein
MSPSFFLPVGEKSIFAFPAREGRDGAKKHYFFRYHGIPAVLLTGWGKTYEAEIWTGWMFFF